MTGPYDDRPNDGSNAENLFERYDLDPHDGTAAITERFRELIEEASSEGERARLRNAWEELTMHPLRRLRLALASHPETRPPIGLPPRRAPSASDPIEGDGENWTPPAAADVALLPSIVEVLTRTARAPAPLPLEYDPILRR